MNTVTSYQPESTHRVHTHTTADHTTHLLSGVLKGELRGSKPPLLVQKAPRMQQQTPSSALKIQENRWAATSDLARKAYSAPPDP